MRYRADETAEFVGLQQLDGSVGGRSGSLTMRSVGTFDGKVAAGTLEVIEGSGTGELTGVSGTGSFSAPAGDEAEVTLDYDLG